MVLTKHFLSQKILVKFTLFVLVFIVLSSFIPLESLPANASKYETQALESKRDPRVVLVSMPRVSFEALSEVQTPNIDRLIEQGSVANLSIRVPKPGRSIEKGYATLSAGTRASTIISAEATFYGPNEELSFGNALSIFESEQGFKPKNASAVLLGLELVKQTNTGTQSPATVGAFGQALKADGKSVAVFGNSDFCSSFAPECNQRAIGFLGSDTSGVVENGDISRRLLNNDLTLNMKLVEDKAKESIKKHDVTAVECSDLEKLERWKRTTTEEVAQNNFVRAVQECDSLIGELSSNLDFKSDQIYIVSPMSTTETEQLTVFIAAGNSIEPGYATSGITRRNAIVALGDIAPSILSQFGIDPPNTMVETEIAFNPSSDSAAAKKQFLVDMDSGAQARDSSFNVVAALFIFTVFMTTLIGILAFRKKPALRPLAKMLALSGLAMTLVPFLMAPFMLSLANSILISIVFTVLSILLAALLYFYGEKYGYAKAVLAFALVNVIVQVADIVTGANLQFNSLFGYSAIVAGRFAGYGNLAFAIVSTSAVVVVAMVKHLSSTNKKLQTPWLNIGLLSFLVLVLVAIGAPVFGSDVGGVLSFTPTVFIIAMMLYEKKIGIKALIVAFLTTMASISVFSYFDLTRPVSERTHLGRFVQVLADGQAAIVIERKLVSNLEILANSIFASVVVLGSLYFLFLLAKPEVHIKKMATQYSAIRFIVYPGLILGFLGMILNDSGVAIPGMMAAVAVPAIFLFLYEQEDIDQSDTTFELEKV